MVVEWGKGKVGVSTRPNLDSLAAVRPKSIADVDQNCGPFRLVCSKRPCPCPYHEKKKWQGLKPEHRYGRIPIDSLLIDKSSSGAVFDRKTKPTEEPTWIHKQVGRHQQVGWTGFGEGESSFAMAAESSEVLRDHGSDTIKAIRVKD
ncbi:hypothetical protein E3N88_41024 [Mikania micrantha]|uniref:Uncharacterized protein n=1 Tax=Mikania micrantha TaxID=192012 RepID=A0A5N6LPD4_9ASTR|nr:hypothetical protein E3N88_41024 [Mikania micrantha]